MSTKALKSYARYDDKEKSLSVDGMLGLRVSPAVTQITSTSTGVTFNAPGGAIVMVSSTLGAGLTESFVFTNSYLSGADRTLFVALHDYTGQANSNPVVRVSRADAGGNTATISVTNIGSAALDDVVTIRFQVLKGAFQ